MDLRNSRLIWRWPGVLGLLAVGLLAVLMQPQASVRAQKIVSQTGAVAASSTIVTPFVTPPLLFDADGSETAPVLSWTVDPDNGPFRIGANNYAFSVGGSKMLEFDTSALQLSGGDFQIDIDEWIGVSVLDSFKVESAGQSGFSGAASVVVQMDSNNNGSGDAFIVEHSGSGNLASGTELFRITDTGALKASPGGDVPSCALYTVTAAALTAAATTEDETLFTLPARGKITAVSVKHTTAFSGGTLSAMTVSVGDSSSTTFYTAAFDIFQAVGDTVFQDTDMFKSSTYAARDVLGRFTATGDNMDNVSAGSVAIAVCWVVLP